MTQSNRPIDITPRQLDVLAQIAAFQSSRCYSATIGELAEALNISRPTAFEHVAGLREKKLITQSNGRARSLRLTAKGKRLIDRVRRLKSRPTPPPAARSNPEQSPWLVAGRISAGYGIEAIENPQLFSVTSFLGSEHGEFLLQVVGSSMIDAGIYDGDYIVCRPSAVADNGQIVVALLEDQAATVKRFFKTRKAVRLQPANDAFEPIIATDCTIQAIVTGVIRRLTR